MPQAAHYTAHRSARRIGVLVALIIVLGLFLLLFDFAAFAPEMETGSGARRLRAAQLIFAAAPWLGGGAVVIGLLFVPRMFRKGVEIGIGPSGITYPPALKQVLLWDRVQRVAVRTIAMQRVLSVWMSDAENFPMKPWARRIALMNRSSGGYGDFNIETLRSDGTFEDLLAAVEDYFPVER